MIEDHRTPTLSAQRRRFQRLLCVRVVARLNWAHTWRLLCGLIGAHGAPYEWHRGRVRRAHHFGLYNGLRSLLTERMWIHSRVLRSARCGAELSSDAGNDAAPEKFSERGSAAFHHHCGIWVFHFLGDLQHELACCNLGFFL